MKIKSLPLVWATPLISRQKTIFRMFDKAVIVEAPGRLVRQLVKVCDGNRSVTEILNLLKDEWDKMSLRKFIGELYKQSVLVDSYNLNQVIWRAIENPSHFSPHITEDGVAELVKQAEIRHKNYHGGFVYEKSSNSLGKLLDRRRSVRTFSNEPVALQDIIDVLWSTYGETTDHHRTVPSAGALFPLMIHVAFFRKTGEFSPAIYSVHMISPGNIIFRFVSKDTLRFIRAYIDPLMLEKANGAIVISGSLSSTAQKYGNRSMLYVPIEAGHAAQNAHLVAMSHGIKTVEIGGFVEELLVDAIKLSRDFRPMTTIVFGHEGKEANIEKIETEWIVPMSNQYRPPFTISLARVSAEINDDWSYGRDVSPSLAHTKAIAEAREWAACGCVPKELIHARFCDLDQAIDPETIIRFHPAQYRIRGFPFKPFDEKQRYEWVECHDEIMGSTRFILADHVYFPYHSKAPIYTYANSSGVAAHPSRQQAIETSTLELIERDSFMIAYLAKLNYPNISERTLPQDVRKRIKDLKRIGFRVWIKDHSLDLAPAMFVFAQSDELTFSTCASSSSFNIEQALDHALMEVEASVLGRLQRGKAAAKKPCDVAMPLDHGALYEQKRYFHRADFLTKGQEIGLRDVGGASVRSWGELLNRFESKGWQLLTIPLFLNKKYGGNGGLHIIRSVVPGMVPMTFGYRQVPGGMERIYSTAKRLGGRRIPYRNLPKLPHPFA